MSIHCERSWNLRLRFYNRKTSRRRFDCTSLGVSRHLGKLGKAMTDKEFRSPGLNENVRKAG
jgi:hypothetical protein